MNARVRAAGLALLAPLLRRGGRAYLLGTDRAAPLAVAADLVAQGYAVTIAYWHADGQSPDDVLAEQLALVDALAGLPGAQMSVKVPGLHFDADRVRAVSGAAAAAGVPLVFDAHAPADADRTLDLARSATRDGAAVGVALPARWARSVRDAAGAQSSGMGIRVVKGQWPDDPAADDRRGEAASRAAFLALVDRVTDPVRPVAVATHDAVLLDRVVRRLRGTGRDCEIELLLGLPARRSLRVAAEHGVPVRFYLAYGHPSLVYSPGAVLRRARLALPLAEGVVLASWNQRLRRREALRSAVGARAQK